MTPFAYAGGNAYVENLDSDGDVGYNLVNLNNAVRPVVSLKSDVISGGVGTVNNPFYVNEKP